MSADEDAAGEGSVASSAPTPRSTWTRWPAAVALFFAWGFTMHAVGLLLHEFAGHALVAVVLGCGIDAYALTFFGHGQVHRLMCDRWTFERVILCDWAGLAVTSAVGLAAGIYLRRRPNLAPMPKLLLAQVAFFFLIGQLGYAVNGGFHDLYDPRRTAAWLGAHGAHWLAWVPPLIAYCVAAVLSARAAVDAFRAHFGSRSRLATLGQLAGTLGVAGILYFVAFRIEWAIRTDLWMRGVTVEAERLAVERHEAPPFPIDKVLLAVAAGALVWALARPVAEPSPPQALGRPTLTVVVGSTAVVFLVVLVLVRAS